jgi:hypothetical protein
MADPMRDTLRYLSIGALVGFVVIDLMAVGLAFAAGGSQIGGEPRAPDNLFLAHVQRWVATHGAVVAALLACGSLVGGAFCWSYGRARWPRVKLYVVLAWALVQVALAVDLFVLERPALLPVAAVGAVLGGAATRFVCGD